MRLELLDVYPTREDFQGRKNIPYPPNSPCGVHVCCFKEREEADNIAGDIRVTYSHGLSDINFFL